MIAVRATAAALLLAVSVTAARADEVAIYRDWIRARCIAVAAGDTPFGRDAAASAGAHVEKGSLPAAAYEAGEKLIAAALAKPLAGSVDVRFDTLKCLDLGASREVGRLAGRMRGR
jgi:hypothetical protein